MVWGCCVMMPLPIAGNNCSPITYCMRSVGNWYSTTMSCGPVLLCLVETSCACVRGVRVVTSPVPRLVKSSATYPWRVCDNLLGDLSLFPITNSGQAIALVARSRKTTLSWKPLSLLSSLYSKNKFGRSLGLLVLF